MKTKIPFDFVLEELAEATPETKPMFGCRSVYIGNKIVFILREKQDCVQDNGVWVATTPEHHASLHRDFPDMRSISLFGSDGPTSWQNIPVDSVAFEESVVRACAMVLKSDPRIGKIPKSRLTKRLGKKFNKKKAAKKKTKRKKPLKG